MKSNEKFVYGSKLNRQNSIINFVDKFELTTIIIYIPSKNLCTTNSRNSGDNEAK